MLKRWVRGTAGELCPPGLHVVWRLKHSRPILGGWGARGLAELPEQISDGRGWQIVAKQVMPDHVRVFDRFGRTAAAALLMLEYKGRAAGMSLEKFSHLRRFGSVYWSYIAALVGYVSDPTACRRGGSQSDVVAP
jgi:putative transposase